MTLTPKQLYNQAKKKGYPLSYENWKKEWDNATPFAKMQQGCEQMFTETEIDNETGFAQGDIFETERDVRKYFTVRVMNDIMGKGESPNQATLNKMADAVIEHRWHMTPRYHCVGDIRGECGHMHHTLKGVLRCLRKDRNGCEKQGGYSDRVIRHTDDSRLTDKELSEMMK